MQCWRSAFVSKLILCFITLVIVYSCSDIEQVNTFPNRYKERVVQRHLNNQPAWVKTFDLKMNALTREAKFDQAGIQIYKGVLNFEEGKTMEWSHPTGKPKSRTLFDKGNKCLKAKLWREDGKLIFNYSKIESALTNKGVKKHGPDRLTETLRFPVWDSQGHLAGFREETSHILTKTLELWTLVDESGQHILTGQVEAVRKDVQPVIRTPVQGWNWADPKSNSDSPEVIVRRIFAALKGDMINLTITDMYKNPTIYPDSIQFRENYQHTYKSKVYLSRFLKQFKNHIFHSQQFRRKYILRFNPDQSFTHEWKSYREKRQTIKEGVNNGLYQMTDKGDALILFYLDGVFKGDTHLVFIKRGGKLNYPFREARYYPRRIS